MQKKAAYVCLCAKKISHVCAVVQKKLCMWLHACEKKFARGPMQANFFCMCLHTCKKVLHWWNHMRKKFACMQTHAKKVCMHTSTCELFCSWCMHANFFACGYMFANFFCMWLHTCKLFLHTCKLMRNFSAWCCMGANFSCMHAYYIMHVTDYMRKISRMHATTGRLNFTVSHSLNTCLSLIDRMLLNLSIRKKSRGGSYGGEAF